MKSRQPLHSPATPKGTRAVASAVVLLSGAAALAVGGYAPDVKAESGIDFMRLWRKSRAAEAYRLAHPELANEAAIARERFVGPPLPERIAVARAAMAERRGGLGPVFGPEAFAGALNTTVSLQGEVRGPIYHGAPLPNTGGLVPLPGEYPQPEAAPEPTGSELDSEIPDQRRIALSRLANPDSTGAASATITKPGTAVEVAAQAPLTLRLFAVKPRGGFRAGDEVAVRLSASAASYAAVIRVDAAGKATIAFKSPAPSTTFACVITTGPNPGSEYYVAIASVKPLNGPEVAQALRTVGMTYASAAPSSEGGLQPVTAWNSAVQYVTSAFPGPAAGAARWQRSDFAVTGTSVAVRAPQAVATAKKPAAETAKSVTPTAPKSGTPTTAPSESVVPNETPKGSPVPAESELPKDNPQATPGSVAAPNGAKWDLPPTTRRPGAKAKGATLDGVPSGASAGLPDRS